MRTKIDKLIDLKKEFDKENLVDGLAIMIGINTHKSGLNEIQFDSINLHKLSEELKENILIEPRDCEEYKTKKSIKYKGYVFFCIE